MQVTPNDALSVVTVRRPSRKPLPGNDLSDGSRIDKLRCQSAMAQYMKWQGDEANQGIHYSWQLVVVAVSGLAQVIHSGSRRGIEIVPAVLSLQLGSRTD